VQHEATDFTPAHGLASRCAMRAQSYSCATLFAFYT
jgi:hypothetical protein